MTDIKAGKIKKVVVEERKVTAEYNGGDKFESYKEPQASFVEILQNAQIDPNKVVIEIEGEGFFNIPFIDLVINILPILLMVGFFFFIFRHKFCHLLRLAEVLFCRTKAGSLLFHPFFVIL